MKNLILLFIILCIGSNTFAQKDFIYKINNAYPQHLIERSNGDFWVTLANSSNFKILKFKNDGTLIEEKILDFKPLTCRELSADKLFFEEYDNKVSVFSNDLTLKKRIEKSPKIIKFDVHENKVFALKREIHSLHLLTYNDNLDSINQQKIIPFSASDYIVSTYFQGDSIRLLTEKNNYTLESYVFNFKSGVLKKDFTYSSPNLSIGQCIYNNEENKYHFLNYRHEISTINNEGGYNLVVDVDAQLLSSSIIKDFCYSPQKGYIYNLKGKTDDLCGDYVSYYFQIPYNSTKVQTCEMPVSNMYYQNVAYSKSGKLLALGIFVNPNDLKQFTNDHFFVVSSGDICQPFKVTSADDFIQEDDVKIYPNPFSESTIIELNGDYKNLTFNLLDINGRLIRSEKFDNQQLIFERKDLQAGLYIYEITSEGKRLQHGKVVVQ